MTKEEAEAEVARLNGQKFRGCETKWFARQGRDGEWGVWYERQIPADHPDAKNPFWGVG